MERVLILGCCGSGKSTLARNLNSIIKLPLIHLDLHYWNAGWQESSKEIWTQKIKTLISDETWIMDGNYGGTLDLRIARADTIIYLDRSTAMCLYRVIKRTIKYKGITRPDMVEGCHERWDWDFFHYILTFNLLRAPKLKRKLNNNFRDKQLIILKTNKQIHHFLEQVDREISRPTIESTL